VDPDAPLATLVAQAWAHRPEIQQSQASVAAARDVRKGARCGPIVPTLGAQVFLGGLGGGIAGQRGRFGESEDYQFTLGWRIGPGGLLDPGRLHAAEARQRQAELVNEKLFDEIRREVVTSQARLRSLQDQLSLARHTVQLAQEGYELSIKRKEFAVGVVLEQVQAEQDLTRARLDYIDTIADFNLAQLESRRAVGGLGESAASAAMRHP
jgi:outer membrane protein TolC